MVIYLNLMWLTCSVESLFYTVGGLPIHALVVHFAVVILPIAVLGILAAIYLPKYASKFTFISLVAAGVGTGFAYIASQSGEALAEKIGLPQDHANYGDILPNVAAAFTIMSVVWYLVKNKKITVPIKFLKHLTAVVGIAVIGLTFITGHTGAQAVWESKIKAIDNLRAPESNTSSMNDSSGAQSTDQNQNSIVLSLTEVKRHNLGSDCWSVINGNVYNLTTFVQRHPGGVGAISSLCGKDGTAAFDNQHGQSSKPNNILDGLLIGNLGATISKQESQVAPSAISSQRSGSDEGKRKYDENDEYEENDERD